MPGKNGPPETSAPPASPEHIANPATASQPSQAQRNIPFIDDRSSFSEEFLQKAAKASVEFDEEVKRLALQLKAKEEASAKVTADSSSSKIQTPLSPPAASQNDATPKQRSNLSPDLTELPGTTLSRKFAKHLGEKPLARSTKEKSEVRYVFHSQL